MKKAASEKKGVDLKISKTRVEKTAQSCGSIFSELLRLARPLIKLAANALASAGLSFGAKKKKVVGNGYGTNEIKFSKLVQAITLEQKKVVKNHLKRGEPYISPIIWSPDQVLTLWYCWISC